MDLAEIRQLARVMRANGILELELQDRRGRIRLVRESASGPASVSRGPTPTPAAEATGGTMVTAPMVGTFFRGSGPGATPFVEVGSVVEPGQVLCVIEAMKLVNEVAAEVRGCVGRILAEDGASVEYGAGLFVLDPA